MSRATTRNRGASARAPRQNCAPPNGPSAGRPADPRPPDLRSGSCEASFWPGRTHATPAITAPAGPPIRRKLFVRKDVRQYQTDVWVSGTPPRNQAQEASRSASMTRTESPAQRDEAGCSPRGPPGNAGRPAKRSCGACHRGTQSARDDDPIRKHQGSSANIVSRGRAARVTMMATDQDSPAPKRNTWPITTLP